MSIERTFGIVKPDAVEKSAVGGVIEMIEKAGLKIVGVRMVKLSDAQARAFYAVHKERPFFSDQHRTQCGTRQRWPGYRQGRSGVLFRRLRHGLARPDSGKDSIESIYPYRGLRYSAGSNTCASGGGFLASLLVFSS